MIKYYTKQFDQELNQAFKIDKWLESMTRPELPASEGGNVKIEGYIGNSQGVIITISRFEKESTKLSHVDRVKPNKIINGANDIQ